MNSVGNVPPLNPSAPVRSETWTDNLGRMGEERLAHVKELIETELGQRTAYFGQSNVSLRHLDDHLVITWEAAGNYGRAWTAWSDPAVRAAHSAMLEKKQQAIGRRRKISRPAAKNTPTRRHFRSGKAGKWRKQRQSTAAWNEYYKRSRPSRLNTDRHSIPLLQVETAHIRDLVASTSTAPFRKFASVASEFGDLAKQL
jgi:hypothetical protein